MTLTSYELSTLRYLAGDGGEFDPAADPAKYAECTSALRERGLLLSLGDSHYLTNAGHTTLRYYAEGADRPEEMLR